MSWLSILVPVYNVQPYLEACLASIADQLTELGQAGKGVQILVLDDCSTDGSWPLLKRLSKRWPGRLKLMRHARNQGLSAARNTLIEAARGEYLWCIDSDDKLLPGALASLHRIVQVHKPDMVLCDFSVWRERERLKHRLRGERHRHSFSGPVQVLSHDRCALLAGLLATGQLHAWSKISRRTLWQDLRFPVGRCFEDMTTMPLLALRASSFYYEPKPWVAYRQRAGSTLANMNTDKARDQTAALRPVWQALMASPCHDNPRVRMALAHQCARSLIGAMHFIRQVNVTEPERQVLAQCLRDDFRAASPLNERDWVQACLKRGWWLRALRFAQAWRVAAG